ncbi:thiamine pyrophosphate-binding protein [Sphingomonas sp.]|uniref:thiamine pyrophosphate-binding protein n=1 Tax=Sphingomonas sp. TaxID=28214 RepID=UPI002DD62E87|nr:thiamine pyrophosphate-dependent enzyme [Sphingomonas sp.]
MKVYQALAHALADNGARTLFGVIGDANLMLVDSFVREVGGRYVAAAHEAGAAMMAIGFGGSGAGLGVCTVTHGPGLANSLTALIEGVKSTMPMVMLCGDTAVLDRDSNQNIAQRELVLATGAGFEQLRDATTVAVDVATAIRRALAERRPIVVNAPIDLQAYETEYAPAPYRAPQMASVPLDGRDIDDAVGVIAAARRPIVLVGRGARDAHSLAAICRLAERIDAPLATTLKAKDAFVGHPYNLGIFGSLSATPALDAISDSDCVLAFGASLNRFTTIDGALLRGKRTVQINREPGEPGRLWRPDVPIVGEPSAVADRLVHWLDVAEIAGSGWRSEALAAAIAAYRPDNPSAGDSAGAIDIVEALRFLDSALPASRMLVTDAGRFVGQAWRHIAVPGPDGFLPAGGFGCVGLGMAQAIGAAMARPDLTTVLAVGDGGFMMGGLAEFNTAVRHGINLVVVLCNDGGYGAEHVQFRDRGMDPALSLFDWPDLSQLARALGGDAVTVAGRDDLARAASAIAARERPLVIELRLDPDRIPPIK